MTRRFWVALGAVGAAAGAGDGRRISAGVDCCAPRRASGCSWSLATPAVLWGGWPFFRRGWASVRNRQPQHVHADRARHRRGLRLQRRRGARARLSRLVPQRDGGVPVYFEAAAVIVTLVLLGPGARIAGAGRRPAARSARSSTSRRNRRACVRDDGSEEDIAARRGSPRRPAAGAARRQGAGRRRRARRARARSTSR